MHLKRASISQNINTGKVSNDAPSTKGGVVYLASISTHSNHGVWLINSGASFHITPQREWFCEYEKYNGGNVFFEDDSITTTIRHGKVKLLLKDQRVKTLPRVLHIPSLAINLISMSKMSDTSMQAYFKRRPP